MEQRRDELRRERTHDPTHPSIKLTDPTVCPGCHATYHEGRWTWRPGPVDAPRHLCSGCQRIKDDYPGGFVRVRGHFAEAHREEILSIARNTEAREKQDHPINRLIDMKEEGGELLMRTTEPHLAQAIGHALEGAFKGKLVLDFEEDVVRILWERRD